jgi:hypothetical protein
MSLLLAKAVYRECKTGSESLAFLSALGSQQLANLRIKRRLWEFDIILARWRPVCGQRFAGKHRADAVGFLV